MPNTNTQSEQKFNTRSIFWTLLAIIYLVTRFVFTQKLDSMGTYASYVFEVADVGIVILLAGRTFFNYFSISKVALFGAAGSLVAGIAVFRAAGFLSIQIPFDLKGTETLLFLLLIAPVLEELIFRFFLWQPIDRLTRKPLIPWISTSILFSYSHLHAMWFVPKEIQSFIVYQTIYTLFLGLASGYFVFKYRSIAGAIAIHFTFNLGFYLGSLL